RMSLRLDRVTLGPREPAPGPDAQVGPGSPPRADDLAGYQHCTWPHAGGPELGALCCVGNEQLATRVPMKEVGIAARQQACGRRHGRLAEALLVAGEDPGVADRSPHSGER